MCGRSVASIRIRQRKDGTAYSSVLYVHQGKQSSTSFNDHVEALRFQDVCNRLGPAARRIFVRRNFRRVVASNQEFSAKGMVMSRRKFWLVTVVAVAAVSIPGILDVIYGPAEKRVVLLAFAAFLALVVVGVFTLAVQSSVQEQKKFEASLRNLPKDEADWRRQERRQQQAAAQIALMTATIIASNIQQQ